MRLRRIEKFAKAVTKGLLTTQQATISQIVCGMIVCRCLILAEIARCFQTQVAFPHNLKRVWRARRVVESVPNKEGEGARDVWK
jgi:ABC-type amino acid transport system permease subunit